MSEDAIFMVVILIAFIAFWGEPDIVDGVIKKLNS